VQANATEKAPNYLIIGHVSRDLTPEGNRPGGTAVYAGLTAQSYGASVFLVTACAENFDLSVLSRLTIQRQPSAQTTVFENRYTGNRREQWIHAVAEPIRPAQIPEGWRVPDIIHLAPIAGEARADLFQLFPRSLRCATLQGMMRLRESDGAVRRRIGSDAETAASAASAVVFSLDDVGCDEAEAERLAGFCAVTTVTEAARGCRVYWNGHVRHFPAPRVRELDPTGAGDIFAAVFFLRLLETRDPYEAARMATLVASRSVARKGLAGIPAHGEILEGKMVVEQL
jgi:sugar/nucleoside kinase (ribokinase family)